MCTRFTAAARSAEGNGKKAEKCVNFLKIRQDTLDGPEKNQYYVNCMIVKSQEDCHGYEALPRLRGEILRYI